MIEIYEIAKQRIKACTAKFKIDTTDFDRVFIMEEGDYGDKKEEIGIGVMGLDKGTVVLKEVKTDKPFSYFDLLARSMLSLIRDMPSLKVKIKNPDPYFYRFGFKDNNGNQEIISDDINLKGSCGKH